MADSRDTSYSFQVSGKKVSPITLGSGIVNPPTLVKTRVAPDPGSSKFSSLTLVGSKVSLLTLCEYSVVSSLPLFSGKVSSLTLCEEYSVVSSLPPV